MRIPSPRQLLQRVDRRPVWTGLEAAASPGSALAIAVGLTATIGAENFGILVMLLALSNIAAALAPAVSAATLRAIAASVGRQGGREDARLEVARTLTAGLCLVGGIAVLVVIAVAFGHSTIVEALSAGPNGDTRERFSAILLPIVIAVVVAQLDGVIGAAIRAQEMFRAQALTELGFRATLAAAVVLTGMAGGEFERIALTYCAVCAVAPVVRLCVYRAVMGPGRLFASPGKRHVRELLGFGGWMWLSALASAAFTSLDRLYIGVVLGGAQAAAYTIYVQVAQLVHFVPSSLAAYSFPVWSRLVDTPGPDARRAARELYLRVTVLTVGVAVALAACVVLLVAAFGNDLRDFMNIGSNAVPLMLLLGAFVLLSATVAPYYFQLAVGNARVVGWITIGAIGASLSLMLLLTPTFGLTGAAAARSGYVVVSLALVPLALGILRRND